MLALTPYHSTLLTIACPALGFSLLMVLIATWRCRIAVQCVAVLLGILVLWAGLVAGSYYGYEAWQAMPDPPDEAFADGAKLMALFLLGWLPAGLVTFAWWGFLRVVGLVVQRSRGSKVAPDSAS
ncbi:MAG: hypothetical protein AAF682_27655 [Planctomycetota bacterium]